MLFLKNSNSNNENDFQNINSDSFCASLRLQKDLMELKQFRMSTKQFKTQFSNIFNDGQSQNYKMFVSIESVINRLHFKFCLIFARDYPYSPPLIRLVQNKGISFQINKEGELSFRFIMKENWSPILSINSIVFALELMLLDPAQQDEISPITLYETENRLKIDYKAITIDYKLEYTNSPKIITITNSNDYFKYFGMNMNMENKQSDFYERKKRLFSEIGYSATDKEAMTLFDPFTKKLKLSAEDERIY